MIEFHDRTAYWLFVIEIPHVRGKELLSAVKFKLSSLYPGNLSDCNIQIRKNGFKKWSYMVFVLDNNTGNTMLPLSPLFVQHVYYQKTENVLYIGKQWIDYVRIKDGAILSSTVKTKNEFQLSDDIKKLCGEETNLIIYCDETDKKLLIPFQQNNNIHFFDNSVELKKIDVHKVSLFAEKSSVIKRRRVLILAAVLFLLTVISWLFYHHKKSENERNTRLRFEQEQERKTALELEREKSRLSELNSRYLEIISLKTATPFDIAVVIAECAEQNTRIQSATFNGNFFQIEGITNNSLNLLSNFEKHRLVDNVRLHQVHPAGNRENFSLSGIIQANTVLVDESIPLKEQIAMLENLIAEETSYGFSENQLSPSAFGEAGKMLFEKWGCTVSSFQFMNDPQMTEIEYSLRGSGSGFFNALHEIKTNHRLWDVRMTQIRNLFPRNMIEVVTRIRTVYHHPKNGEAYAVPKETVAPFPIVNISRNYFTATPSIARPTEPVVIEQVPAVIVPARAQRVTWLEYVGSVRDNDVMYIYLKNTRTGAILRLGNFAEGNMRYVSDSSGNIIAYMDDNIYEINRR